MVVMGEGEGEVKGDREGERGRKKRERWHFLNTPESHPSVLSAPAPARLLVLRSRARGSGASEVCVRERAPWVGAAPMT